MERIRKKKSPLFYALVLPLSLSCIALPLFALPLSRNSKSESQEKALQFGQVQVEINKQVMMMDEHYGRMDIEVNDYPGSGANPRHDPKSPGTP